MKLTVSVLVLSFIISTQAANTITSESTRILPSGIPGSGSLSSPFSSESSVERSIFSSGSSAEKSILSSHSSIARSIISSNSSHVHSAFSSSHTHIPSSLLTSLPGTIHPTTTGAESAEATTTSSAVGGTEA
ncbi:hypothetical protein BDR04DRAFT_317056 [Suillus decipiens]|nr:hypothetical protein BDR04DRAFT_317056 [Suillus decipiens]